MRPATVQHLKRFAFRSYHLDSYLQCPGDGRLQPQIPSSSMIWALIAGQLLRECSFHAIEALVRSPARSKLGVSRRFGDAALGYFTEGLDPTSTRRTLTTETSYFDPGGSVGAEYRLFARNDLGEEFLLGCTILPPDGPLAAWPIPYFGGSMTISFFSPGGAGGLGRAATEISVYDMAGRLARRIVRSGFPQGVNLLSWDGRDEAGRPLPGGVYFLKSICGDRAASLKFVLIR